jgi:AmmeMemoRadiSam system protein B
MKIRKQLLPPGWYPSGAVDIERFIEGCIKEEGTCRAALSPHAGWYFAGALACRAVSSLDRSAATVVVLGGHLAAQHPVLAAMEDAVETPLGLLDYDAELRTALLGRLAVQGFKLKSDLYQDNTVEVLLPFVKYFFPNAKLVALRVPPRMDSLKVGSTLADLSAEQGKKIVVLGSSDLTHYGPNYEFTPKGLGKEALDWVRNTNDAAFIKALCDGDAEAALKQATQNQAACSSGAALGCLGFCQPDNKARCLAYATSADKTGGGKAPDSFVGYAAICW